MVFTGRQRKGPPFRMACGGRGVSVRRLLILGGFLATGWLLGGAGAALAEQLPEEPPTETATRVEHSARSASTGEPAREAGAERGENEPVVRPESAGEADGSTTADSAVESARDTATRATRGVADAVLDAGEARRSTRARTHEGPAAPDSEEKPAAWLRDLEERVRRASESSGPLGSRDGESAALDRPTRDAGAGDGGETDRRSEDGPRGEGSGADAADPSTGRAAVTATDSRRGAPEPMESGEVAPTVTSGSAVPSEPLPLTIESIWPHPTDSGATAASPSPAPAPAMAAYLAGRIDAPFPASQRGVSPEAPAHAVRDAASEPAVSPD